METAFLMSITQMTEDMKKKMDEVEEKVRVYSQENT